MRHFKVLFGPLLITVLGAQALAAGITYHGRLLTSAGRAVTEPVVQFKIQILSAGSENCLMYGETHTRDMSGTDGIFAITINDGTATSLNTEPFSLDRVFQNRGTFNFAGGKCAIGSTYTPNPGDGRKILVQFNDGTFSGWENLPMQAIEFVPTAMESMTVGGYGSGSMLRVNDGTGAPASIAALTQTQYNSLLDVLAGKLQGSAVSPTAPTASGQVLTWNNSTHVWEPSTPAASGVSSVSASPPLSSTGGATPTLSIAQADASTNGYLSSADWTTFNGKQASLGFTPVNQAGDAMSGALAVPADGFAVGTSQLSAASGNIGIGTSAPIYQLDVTKTNTQTSGTEILGRFLLTVDPTANSTGSMAGLRAEAKTSSTYNLSTLQGALLYANNSSTGTLAAGTGVVVQAFNQSTGTATSLIGVRGDTRNVSTGTVGTAYGAYNSARNLSTGTMTTAYGTYSLADNAANGAMTSAYGTFSRAQNLGTSAMTNLYGALNIANNGSTGTVSVAYGTNARIDNTGTITSAMALNSQVNNNGSIGSMYGARVDINNNASSSATTGYGMRIDVTNAGTLTNWYGLYLGDSGSSSYYGVYSAGSQKSYFGGNVGIGTTNPGTKLEVAGPIKPGTATTGGACSPEGAFAYDATAHAPIFCNSSGVWAAMGGGGTVPPGTWCGALNWSAPYYYGGLGFMSSSGSMVTACNGTSLTYNGSGGISNCPSGYSTTTVYTAAQDGSGTYPATGIATCMKN